MTLTRFAPQAANLAELHEIQRAGLRWTVAHAYANSPFYRERLDRAGVRPEDIRTLADLERETRARQRRDGPIRLEHVEQLVLPSLYFVKALPAHRCLQKTDGVFLTTTVGTPVCFGLVIEGMFGALRQLVEWELLVFNGDTA